MDIVYKILKDHTVKTNTQMLGVVGDHESNSKEA